MKKPSPLIKTTLALASAALLLFSNTPAKAADTGVKITDGDGKLRIELDGKLFTEYLYNSGKSDFFPIFYPVLGPGEVEMTRDYPMKKRIGESSDHPHHRSLWFGHHDINGVDFWAVKATKGKQPLGKTVHQKFTSIKSGKDSGSFTSENNYLAPDGKIIMTDERTITIYKRDPQTDARILDFTITFKADHGKVIFGDNKDGCMAIRLHPSMRVDEQRKDVENPIKAEGHILNSEGVRDKPTWGKRAKWVDMTGPVDGKAVGVAIFDHPSNLRHPTWWHARSYGLISANPFGKHHFEDLKDNPSAGNYTLEEGKTLTLRYRFYFHLGDEKQGKVAEHYQAFSKE
ncbi:MAG: PmoA family protein [Verrucomicrobiales bacterium]|nr:PmoA family protein [Verrucomicrobiales bacterium]